MPVDSNTSHALIWEMADKPCVHCGDSLDWTQLGIGKTPHLDHDHETGEVNGFSHPSCKPLARKNRIEKLEKQNRELEEELVQLKRVHRIAA